MSTDSSQRLQLLKTSGSLAAVMWVWIFGGIALAGLIMLICYGVWLAHKLSDLWSEVEMLGRRGEELAALLEQLDLSALDAAREDS